MFGKYHYLSQNHNNAARVYIATANGMICAFCSVLPFPHYKIKNAWKAHRTVVLPDFQGVGIGHTVSSMVGELLLSQGKRFLSVTSHPAFIHSRKNDPRWRVGRFGRITGGKNPKSKIHNNPQNTQAQSNGRITVSFEYMGNNTVKTP